MAEIVLFPSITGERFLRFAKAAEPLQVVSAETTEEAYAELKSARGFVGKMTPELLAIAPQLEWIQTATASLEHYMFPALIEHPCVLTNIAGIFGDVISEHVLGYVLSFNRNLHLYRDFQRERRYRPVGAESLTPDFVGGPHSVTSVDLAHRRIAETSALVVGLGGIGRAVAAALGHFGATVDAVDPIASLSEDAPDRSPHHIGAIHRPETLPSVIDQYDYVVICAPHTPATEGLFGTDLLQRMHSDSVLINVGRGAIVQLADLEAVLASGHLRGAALDVFDQEPLPPESSLWSTPNVLITPHVAACCTAIASRHAETIEDNLRRFASGLELRNVVRKAEWF